jgi:hypothetical protein
MNFIVFTKRVQLYEAMERHGDKRATPKSITYEIHEEWEFDPSSFSKYYHRTSE